jgi:hypothetical protein
VERSLDEAYLAQKAALGRSHQNTLTTLQTIIRFYEDRGIYDYADKALVYVEALVSGQVEAFGPSHYYVIQSYLHQLYLLAISGRWNDCKNKAIGLAQLVEAQPSSDEGLLAQIHAIRALAEFETGAPVNAEKWLDTANYLARKTNRADIVAIVQNQFGWYLHRTRNSDSGYLLLTSLQNLPRERLYLELGIRRLIQFYQDVHNLQQRDQWLWNLAEMQWQK